MLLRKLAKKVNSVHFFNYFYKYAFPFLKIEVLSYNGFRGSVFSRLEKIKREISTLVSYSEAYVLYALVKNTAKVKGDIAEVGVYRGGTARILSEAKGDRKLYLFDTFAGLPGEDKFFEQGDYKATLAEAKANLRNISNVYFYKGLFPQSAILSKDKVFSFVHLDVDLYKSTIDALEYFYPKISKGGIIITHDYLNSEGVRKAFNDFLKDKKEVLIELPTTQCLIVKI